MGQQKTLILVYSVGFRVFAVVKVIDSKRELVGSAGLESTLKRSFNNLQVSG